MNMFSHMRLNAFRICQLLMGCCIIGGVANLRADKQDALFTKAGLSEDRSQHLVLGESAVLTESESLQAHSVPQLKQTVLADSETTAPAVHRLQVDWAHVWPTASLFKVQRVANKVSWRADASHRAIAFDESWPAVGIYPVPILGLAGLKALAAERSLLPAVDLNFLEFVDDVSLLAEKGGPYFFSTGRAGAEDILNTILQLSFEYTEAFTFDVLAIPLESVQVDSEEYTAVFSVEEE